MSESECRLADWHRVGFQDGANGVAEQRLATYAEDCGKVGVHPNAAAYRQGWDLGINRYCTAANGWRAGVGGQESRTKVCAGQAGEAAFNRHFSAGLQLYRTQQDIQDNAREIDRLQKQLTQATTDDERRRIRRQLQSIDDEQYRLRVRMGQQQLMEPH